jgi:hypothetical protein
MGDSLPGVPTPSILLVFSLLGVLRFGLRYFVRTFWLLIKEYSTEWWIKCFLFVAVHIFIGFGWVSLLRLGSDMSMWQFLMSRILIISTMFSIYRRQHLNSEFLNGSIDGQILLIIGSRCFSQTILTFYSWKNLYWKFIYLIKVWITWSQKKLAKPQSQIEIKIKGAIFVVQIWKYEAPVLYFHNCGCKYVVPYADSWISFF